MIGLKPTPPPSCNNYVAVGLGDGGGEERLIGFGWSQVLQTAAIINFWEFNLHRADGIIRMYLKRKRIYYY